MGVWNNGATAKIAAAYALNDIATTQDGAAPQTDATATIPTVTGFSVGHFNGVSQFFGPISRIGYFARRLADQTLVKITS
jgi:hypothetical protein